MGSAPLMQKDIEARGDRVEGSILRRTENILVLGTTRALRPLFSCRPKGRLREGRDLPKTPDADVLERLGFDKPCLFNGRRPRSISEGVWEASRRLSQSFGEWLGKELAAARNGVAVGLKLGDMVLVVDLGDDPETVITVGGTMGHQRFQHRCRKAGHGERVPTRQEVIELALKPCCVKGEPPTKVGCLSRLTRKYRPGWKVRTDPPRSGREEVVVVYEMS